MLLGYSYVGRQKIIAPVRIASWSALVLSVLPGIEVVSDAVLRHSSPFSVFFGGFPDQHPTNPVIVGLAFLLAGLFIFGLLMAASTIMIALIDIRGFGKVMPDPKGLSLPDGKAAPASYPAEVEVPSQVPTDERQFVRLVKTASWSALVVSILSLFGWTRAEATLVPIVGLAFLLAGLFIFGLLMAASAAMEATNTMRFGFTRRPRA